MIINSETNVLNIIVRILIKYRIIGMIIINN